MATNTYVALETKTLTSAVSSVTFDVSTYTNYTDLQIVFNGGISAASANSYIRFNGDTGSNYGSTFYEGRQGGAAATTKFVSSNVLQLDYYGSPSTTQSMMIIDIFSFRKTGYYRTVMSKYGDVTNASYSGVGYMQGVWMNTADAITSIQFYANAVNWNIGSTFTLYGIQKFSGESTPKAIGGYVSSDSSYWYHSFINSGTFIPNQTLSCDYMVIAGGGGGAGASGSVGGGGGAGGLRTFTSQSITAGTYTVTVGAGGSGGVGNANGSSGNISTFNSNSSSGGGYGAIQGSNGGSGGSGGAGGWTATSGGAGNAGGYTPVEGYAGASTTTGSSYDSTGGGGGAGGVGTTNGLHIGGNGGIGATSSLINAIGAASGFGQQNSGNYYFAGGGGGAAGYDAGYATRGEGGIGGGGYGGTLTTASGSIGTLANNGTTGTGGGGGGAVGGTVARNGGNGGSGIVIVRYAK